MRLSRSSQESGINVSGLLEPEQRGSGATLNFPSIVVVFAERNSLMQSLTSDSFIWNSAVIMHTGNHNDCGNDKSYNFNCFMKVFF